MKKTIQTLKKTDYGLEGRIKFLEFDCQLLIDEVKSIDKLTESQKSCIKLGLEYTLSEETLKAINRYYEEIKDYIGECDLKLENYQGIIKHFKPIQFIIDEGDFKPYLRVHCECAWEEEHGLELVILKGKTIYVGSCSNEPIDWILDEENENEWNFA